MSDLLAILTAWTIGGGAIVGCGSLLSRLASPHIGLRRDYFATFWLGLAAIVALAQIWHLWFPINTAFAILVCGVGVLGIVRSNALSDLAHTASRSRLAVACFLVGTVWLALMGLRPLEIYDAGLYHLQAIGWNTAFPTVPGLGNLHGRLAFYSSFFLLLAAFDGWPLLGQSYRAVVGLLTLVFLTQLAISVVPVVRGGRAPGQISPSDWLLALMALPSLATIGANGLATTSPDLPLFPIQVLSVFYLMRWLENSSTSQVRLASGDAQQPTTWLAQRASSPVGDLAAALMLAALAATIKLSGLAFSLAVLALVLFVGARYSIRWRPLLTGTVVAGVLIAGMLINSVMLSGYPFYPSTVLGIPVDWRVPESHANTDRIGIELFARQPAELAAQTFEGLAWFPPWLAANAITLASPVLGAIVGLFSLIATLRTTVATSRRSIALLLMPVYAGIVVWFVTAPSYRFVGALLWLAGAIPLAAFVSSSCSRFGRAAAGVFVLLAVLPPQTEPLSLMFREPIAAVRHGVDPLPVEPMITFTTDSGLVLNVPATSELAWSAALPTTPVPDKHLRLRCPDTLACGFMTDP